MGDTIISQHLPKKDNSYKFRQYGTNYITTPTKERKLLHIQAMGENSYHKINQRKTTLTYLGNGGQSYITRSTKRKTTLTKNNREIKSYHNTYQGTTTLTHLSNGGKIISQDLTKKSNSYKS